MLLGFNSERAFEDHLRSSYVASAVEASVGVTAWDVSTRLGSRTARASPPRRLEDPPIDAVHTVVALGLEDVTSRSDP